PPCPGALRLRPSQRLADRPRQELLPPRH
ncbi:Hypothetical protein NocV09_03000080, partial [Nannochloropsis oceanica]